MWFCVARLLRRLSVPVISKSCSSAKNSIYVTLIMHSHLRSLDTKTTVAKLS